MEREYLDDAPPLPKKKPAVFHHPSLGMDLYDGIAMDLHAMRYAEPLLQEIARLREALTAIKGRVCGEAMPRWENTERTGVSRGWIADVCDSALTPNSNLTTDSVG